MKKKIKCIDIVYSGLNFLLLITAIALMSYGNYIETTSIVKAIKYGVANISGMILAVSVLVINTLQGINSTEGCKEKLYDEK